MRRPKKKNYIKSLNPLKFLSVMRERVRKFRHGSKNPLPKLYPVNELARKLHPKFQYVKIIQIIERSDDCKTFTLAPDKEKGTQELAYFASGKYISLFLNIEGLKITRAYSLCSAPKDCLGPDGFYQITVKAVGGGLVSNYILENWKVGDQVKISAPEGQFEYVYLRDAPTVVCIAGGSGITPFLSMARSICNGDEDFNMVLLYGSRNKDSILFKEEFDELQKKNHRIRVIHVLSDEKNDVETCAGVGMLYEPIFEKGFITADLIKKYAPDSDYSVFLCGPQAMYNFLDKELEKLNLPKKYIRHEMFGEIHSAQKQEGYPGFQASENAPLDEAQNPQVAITITVCDETKTVYGNPDDTILQILEKNGIGVPSRCRSGECGWCHSYLKSGKVFVPQKMDFRRKADLKYSFIHPCCTFALSDLQIDVPPQV